MTFEAALADLSDPEKRIASKDLVDFSNLDADESAALAEAWPDIDVTRRHRLLVDLAEMAEDNVELNFDAVFKTALTDTWPEVRVAALRGLYEYEGTDLIGVLTEMLRGDPDTTTRREAAIALGRFALAGELGQLRNQDFDAVKAVLMESAEDIEEDERVRSRAIEALGAISGEDTENLIESIYQEESIWMKVGAVDAMGRTCSEIWTPLIVREMENPSPEMRHAAAFAAGEIGDEEAIEPLRRLAAFDPDRLVQSTAIKALSEIGGRLAEVALKSLLYEGDEELRIEVQEALTDLAFEEDPLSPPGLI